MGPKDVLTIDIVMSRRGVDASDFTKFDKTGIVCPSISDRPVDVRWLLHVSNIERACDTSESLVVPRAT